ncbi:hypothetical protein HQQ81_08100 [Microbacteriaceae bacterium VKM Ac-2854]|nr:hypothetical protein [Microbacteriaceae bacterium VKM Ac-2854]
MSQTTDALAALIAALEHPGAVNPGLAALVSRTAHDALVFTGAIRVPGVTLDLTTLPIAALDGPEESPPIPPAAL